MVELKFERLYLAKDGKDSKQDIYVDKCPPVQHQLDGIRYLYRAFKKKNPAVIINDPSGYGKRVQIALFLSSVLPTLNQPVLILCREGMELTWMRHFQQWTQVSDDVVVELSNPLVKKKVLISALYCATAFARRDWSVLVVDDDLISKDMLKSSLRADLKVWVTSSSIKEDLGKFSTFYSWIYPKEKFYVNRFRADKSDLNEVLVKTAMLDAFLENIVLRRDLGVGLFKKNEDPMSNNTTEIRVTKKNKDATGTKIKRSKRKSDVDNAGGTNGMPSIVTKTKNTIEQNTEVFEMGNLEQPTKLARTIFSSKDNATEDIEKVDINAQSDDEDFALLRHKKSKKSKSLWDSENIEHDLEETSSGIEKQDTTQLDVSGNVLRWDSDTDSENENQNCLDSNVKQPERCEHKLDLPSNDRKLEEIVVENDDVTKSGSLSVSDENKIEIIYKNDIVNEITDKINPVNDMNKFSEDLFSTDLTINPNEMNVREIIYEQNIVDEPINTDKANETENKNNTNNIKQKEMIEKTDQKVSENAKLNSFELKMKQMEELALKKYKGSILDSIF